ncbi:MAG: response regulator [Myxococcota bacterium]
MTTATPQQPRILVVDDDDTFRQRLARALAARGYAVVEAADFDAALAQVAATADSGGIDRAVVDLRMPGRSDST